MSVYLVTWDLNDEVNYGAARDKLMKRIKDYTHIKDSKLDSVVFIASTNWKAEDISDDLRKCIDDSDHIFVTKIGTDRQGWLNKEAWDFIKANT